ncbi:MAG: ABC transporter ATP-binding protein [Armatimonadetes bacterium]|nr:ABC transporter ATP-binding protein [Armatimonadota bacterium]
MTHFAIETHLLAKRYGRLQAVDGLSLRVPVGCIYGFLGPNGAGKSTTIRMLLGLIRPTGGEAFVLGQPARPDHPATRREIGALVEGPAFVDYLSARRNLEMLLALSGGVQAPALQGRRNGSDVDRALELVGLTSRQRDRVKTFSHGMKQRLGVAGALLGQPRLVILDEPANGLDPQGLVEVRDLLRRLRDEHGMTIFLSSHLLHEVQLLCDEVGVVRQGRLIAAGPVAELLAGHETELQVQVDDADRAREVAEALPYVQQVAADPDGLRLTVEPGKAADLNAALVGAGLRVSALTPAAPDLERFYLELVKTP